MGPLVETLGGCDFGANPLVWQYFGDCIYTRWEGAAFCIGLSSILFWVYAQVPQFIRNMRTGSVEALSPWFLVQWLGGDTANLLGCILDKNQLITQLYTAAYFIVADIIVLTQYIYYQTQEGTSKELPAPCEDNEDDDDLSHYTLLMPRASTSSHTTTRSVHGAWEAGSASCKRDAAYHNTCCHLSLDPPSPTLPSADYPSLSPSSTQMRRRLWGWWRALSQGDLGWQGVGKCLSTININSSNKNKKKNKENSTGNAVEHDKSESVRPSRGGHSNHTQNHVTPPATRVFQRMLKRAVDEIGLDSSAHFLVGHDWHLGLHLRPLPPPAVIIMHTTNITTTTTTTTSSSTAASPTLPREDTFHHWAAAAAPHVHPLSPARQLLLLDNNVIIPSTCIACQHLQHHRNHQQQQPQLLRGACQQPRDIRCGSRGREGNILKESGEGEEEEDGVFGGMGKRKRSASSSSSHEISELDQPVVVPAQVGDRLQLPISISDKVSKTDVGKKRGGRERRGNGQVGCMYGLVGVVGVMGASMMVMMMMTMRTSWQPLSLPSLAHMPPPLFAGEQHPQHSVSAKNGALLLMGGVAGAAHHSSGVVMNARSDELEEDGGGGDGVVVQRGSSIRTGVEPLLLLRSSGGGGGGDAAAAAEDKEAALEVQLTNWVELLGISLGWLSSAFYLGSRVAQILKTHSRGSAEGLALEMFGCAIAGNLTYGVAVLMRADSWVDIYGSGPWLLGSLGTLFLDITIFLQAQWLAHSARHQQYQASVCDV